MLQTVLLQVDSTATASSAESINYLSLLLKGGIVIYPILILLFVTIFFMIERYLFIRSASNIDFGFLRALKDNILRGDLRTAATLCKSTNLPIARILEKGITRIGRPVKDIESAMEIQSNLEVSKMEKNMGSLGLIAGIAPTVGFIGTISGVIKIFYSISITENVSIGNISGGLYEKMISSGAGLIVGIIGYAGYHILNAVIDAYALRIQQVNLEFIKSTQP